MYILGLQLSHVPLSIYEVFIYHLSVRVYFLDEYGPLSMRDPVCVYAEGSDCLVQLWAPVAAGSEYI